MSDQDPAAGGAGADEEFQLSDAERELLEQQMREVRVEDLLAQTVASLLNLSARRILKEDEVDLGQARLGIDAVRALIEVLPDEIGAAAREPLSQVQMLYAQRSGGAPAAGEAGGSAPEGTGGEAADDGPAPGGSGLWVPGQ